MAASAGFVGHCTHAVSHVLNCYQSGKGGSVELLELQPKGRTLHEWNEKLHHIMTKYQSKDDHAKSVQALLKECKPEAAALEQFEASDHALYLVGNRLDLYKLTKNTSKPNACTKQRYTVSVEPCRLDFPLEAGVVPVRFCFLDKVSKKRVSNLEGSRVILVMTVDKGSSGLALSAVLVTISRSPSRQWGGWCTRSTWCC